MDEDKNATETRYVLWGLVALMALAGVVLLGIALFGNGLGGGTVVRSRSGLGRG